MLSKTVFRKYCYSSDWYRPNLKVLVACSGGVDSTVLLHLLTQIKNLEISVVHFDHQLRGVESDTDREFIEQVGTDLGYPVHLVTEDIEAYAKQNALSLEEAGSVRRRSAFMSLKDQLAYDFVATGQHFDDQIETILMNIYQGSGIQGLSGISECNGGYIRPLLRYTRDEIDAYSKTHELEYRTDQSNEDISFLRNNIRANVIPALSIDIDHRLRTSVEGILREGQTINGLIETSIEDVDIKGFRSDYAPKIALGLGKLPDYFSPIQKAIFDRAFQLISMMPQGISSNHFNALKSLYGDEAIGKEIQLPTSVTAYRDRGGITLFKRSDYQWSKTSLSINSENRFPFFHFAFSTSLLNDHIHDPAYLWVEHNSESYRTRVVESGDKMVVDATGRLVSVFKILQSSRVAPHLKEYYPIVERDGELVWIPGIRTAHSALISEEVIKENRLKHCIKFQFQKGTFE